MGMIINILFHLLLFLYVVLSEKSIERNGLFFLALIISSGLLHNIIAFFNRGKMTWLRGGFYEDTPENKKERIQIFVVSLIMEIIIVLTVLGIVGFFSVGLK